MATLECEKKNIFVHIIRCQSATKKNIRVNAVCPGAIKTPMLDRFPKEQEEFMADQDPMGRIGRPEEIAESVLWLCSDKSSYVTGQAIAIDGGWVAQ